MKDRLYNLMCEADIESGCVYGDCDLKFIADHLIDSGLVIALPCKVGDTVYWIYELPLCPHIDGGMGPAYTICETEFEYNDWEYLGECVFLTKEEAEAKLAELNNRDAINTEVNYSDAMNVYRELYTHDREKTVSELAELEGTEE